MKSKLKLTGFARFIIFLLFIAPIAYFGAKFIRSSGILDKTKDSSEEVSIDLPSEDDILEEISRKGATENKSQEAIIEEQRRKIEELERQNRNLQNNTSRDRNQPSSPPPSPTPPQSSSGDKSFDDLLREADDYMRDKGVDDGLGTTRASTTKESSTDPSKAVWSFSFSGISGTIELYLENDRVISRTTYDGNNRVDVSELVQQGEKLFVKDSPTGEYYILKSNGDLDAFDRNGFQTTCRRK